MFIMTCNNPAIILQTQSDLICNLESHWTPIIPRWGGLGEDNVR